MPRKLLLPILVLCTSSGCGDSIDAIFRDARNQKNEAIDLFLKVNDEKDAKAMKDTLLKKATERFENTFKDRQDKWEKNFETKKISDFVSEYYKEQKEPFNPKKYDKTAFKTVLGKVKKENRDKVEDAFNSIIAYHVSEEASEKRLEGAVNRLGQIVAKLKSEKEEEMRKKGDNNPIVNPKDHWPNLVDLHERDFKQLKKLTINIAGLTSSGGPPPGAGMQGGPPGGGMQGGPPGGGMQGGPPGGGMQGGPPGGGMQGGPPGKQ